MRLHLHKASTSLTVFTAASLLLAGASVIPTKMALTSLSDGAQRRAAMLSAGVDRMPVGTAGGVDRAKRARSSKD